MNLYRKLIGKKSRRMNSRKNNKTKVRKHSNKVKTKKNITPLKNSNGTPFGSSTKLPVTTSNDAPVERPILNQRRIKSAPADLHSSWSMTDKDFNLRGYRKRKQRTKRRIIGGNGNTECPICGSEFKSDDEIITLKCGHIFHKDELIGWCKTKGLANCTCPMDRTNISEEMEQYMPIPPPTDSDSDSESDSESDSVFDMLIFITATQGELTRISSEPLIEMPPYIINANLPSGVAGGPKERIKNMLVKLFANYRYFSIYSRELAACSDKNNNEEIKIDLISQLMGRINDTRNYTDYQLKVIIRNYLQDCAEQYL